ncbi:MAG TPA: alpha/beta hydrolase [Patescibacteria group bacterium]
MKNALILHGTEGNSKENWFEWLKTELKKNDWLVWVPDLPQSDKPNVDRYNTFLFSNKKWQFNKDSILIGHSSGAVAILGMLQNLPDNVRVDTCYLVGAFKDDLGWDSLKSLFDEPFDFLKIKSKAKNFIFIHSDNDPYCPLDHAKYLAKELDGQLIVKRGQKHFNVRTMGKSYEEFPSLLQIISSRQEKKEYQERITCKVEKLKSRKASRAFAYDLTLPDRYKQKDIQNVFRQVERVKILIPEVLKLIKGIKPHFTNIWDQNELSASYILLGRAYSNLQTAIDLAKKGRCVEMIEVARSAHEALDLIFLFLDRKSQQRLKKWFEGEIIDPSITRTSFEQAVTQLPANTSLPVYELKNKVYKIYSLYTHSSYGALFDYIDVFREDFDFQNTSGFHYVSTYFDVIVNNLLINIILALKNVYGVLKDHNNFAKTNELLKLAGHVDLKPDQIKKILYDGGL